MKPVTPQDFAKCYGKFIANANIVIPKYNKLQNWLTVNLPDVIMIYNLNKSAFSAYTASITSFPNTPKEPQYNPKGVALYNADVNLKWTAIEKDLKTALTSAETDPTKVKQLIASFRNMNPAFPKTFKFYK